MRADRERINLRFYLMRERRNTKASWWSRRRTQLKKLARRFKQEERQG